MLRTVDDLSRISIPKEFLKEANIKHGDEVDVSFNGGKIILSKKASWVKKTDDFVYYYVCSACDGTISKSIYGADYFSNFCPHCGAKMYEGDN